jgi:hypothetical protein
MVTERVLQTTVLVVEDMVELVEPEQMVSPQRHMVQKQPQYFMVLQVETVLQIQKEEPVVEPFAFR